MQANAVMLDRNGNIDQVVPLSFDQEEGPPEIVSVSLITGRDEFYSMIHPWRLKDQLRYRVATHRHLNLGKVAASEQKPSPNDPTLAMG